MKSYIHLACLLAIALCLGGLPCQAESTGEDETTHGQEQAHGKTIRLTEDQMAEFGIILEEAGPATIETVIELPGEIRPNQDRIAHLVPRFAGVATEVRKKIGDPVKQGDVLAIIESSESLSTYRLKSLLDGIVIAKHITRGESVSSDREAFVVADLRAVWVDLSVYQKDLDQLEVGQKVLISAGHGHPAPEATISYIAPVVDHKTRTAVARVVLPNLGGVWRPGLFVTGAVTVESAEATVAVPRSAVQTLGEKSVVFVLAEDQFEPRSVKLGHRDRERVEVLEGLEVGERIVAHGSFVLKSELDKAGFEAGHGH